MKRLSIFSTLTLTLITLPISQAGVSIGDHSPLKKSDIQVIHQKEEQALFAMNGLVGGIATAGVCETPPVDYMSKERALAFARTRKCDDLFSLTPPAAEKAQIEFLPEANLFKTDSNWQPFCSLDRAQYLNAGGDPDEGKGFEGAAKHRKEMYVCGDREQDTTLKNHKSQSQSEANVKKMSAEKLEAREKAFLKVIRPRMASSCCGSDAECSKAIQSIPYRHCVSTAKKKTDSDDCIDQGTFYTLNENDPVADRADRNAHLLTKYIKKLHVQSFDDPTVAKKLIHYFKALNPKLALGHIQTNDFEDKTTEKPLDSIQIIYHELSHACSQIRRQLSAMRGDVNAIRNYARDLNEEAHQQEFNTEEKNTYHDLAVGGGLSQATSDCLYQMAKDSRAAMPGLPPCPNAQPLRQIEEGFADVFSTAAMDETEFVPWVLPDFCDNVKDGEHPATGDLLRCMVQTDSIRSKLYRATGCQQ